jgi:hypothetical protein
MAIDKVTPCHWLKQVEGSPLNEPERNTLRKANDLVVKLRHDEESKWA